MKIYYEVKKVRNENQWYVEGSNGWLSIMYDTRKEAIKKMNSACWGEGINTI